MRYRAARSVRGRRHARGTVDNPASSPNFYPQGSTDPGRFTVQTNGATSVQTVKDDMTTEFPAQGVLRQA